MLEQQKPDHKSRLDPGAALIAVQRRDLPVDELPVNLPRSLASVTEVGLKNKYKIVMYITFLAVITC